MAVSAPAGTVGDIYTLHFDRPLFHAKHYRGWALDAEARIELHRRGQSRVKIMDALFAAGIGFTVAEVRRGTRDDERRMKNSGGACRTCPICRAERGCA